MLIIWPPEIPTSANSFTYHYIDFLEPISFLKDKNCNIDYINLGLLNSFKQELYIKLLNKPEKIAIYSDIHMKDETLFVLGLINRISPESETIVYGPLSTFYQDALLENTSAYVSGIGDYETILLKFYHKNSYFKDRVINGYWMDGNDIVFPNIEIFNPEDYQRLLDLDRNRKQPINLAFSVARGCSFGCSYCRVNLESNNSDRRVSVDRVIKYILDAKNKYNISYFKLLSPNFASNKEWNREFLNKVKTLNIKWKCCTRPEYFLDFNFAKELFEAGCVSVSIGLESFTDYDYKIIGRKGNFKDSIKSINNLIRANISVKCLTMFGTPNSSVDNILEGVKYIESLGAVVRPTLYTNYSLLSWDDISFADKRTPVHLEHTNDILELVSNRNGKMY